METASGLIDAISGSVNLIGNLNSLSVIQDDIVTSTNGNHINLVAQEMGLIKVGGVGGGGGFSPLLPETSDLIYTDLSNNVTLKQEHHHHHHNHNNHHQVPVQVQVPGGEYSSSTSFSWGGGFGDEVGALNDLNLVKVDLNNGSSSNQTSLGGGGGGGALITTPIKLENGIDDLDKVSIATPSLSDNDNFSFLSDCSENGVGGGGLGGVAGGGEFNDGDKFSVKNYENDYVQAWVSSEPPNPFPLPSLATVSSILEQQQQQQQQQQTSAPDSISELFQLPLLDGGGAEEGDSFSTINANDLDDLLGPSTGASASTAPAAGLRCADCCKTFDNPMTLQIHMRLHTGERPYKCKSCGEAFIHYTYLDYHLKNSHGIVKGSSNPNQRRNSNPSPAKSKSGGAIPHTNGQLSNPSIKAGQGNSRTKVKSKKKKNGLVDGGTNSNDPTASSNHNHPSGAGGPYPCPYCQRGFRHSSWLIAHLRTHTGEKPFKCGHCDSAYSQRGNLMSHLRKYHKIPESEIAAMNITAATTGNATTATPMKIAGAHPHPSPTVAAQTTPSFSSTNLTVRRKQIKKKKPSAAAALPTTGGPPNNNNQTVGNYNYHQKLSTPTVATQNQKGSRPVRCTICGEEFSQRQALSVHMHSHGDTSYQCSDCGRKFRQSANLQKHIRDMHGGISNASTASKRPPRRQSAGKEKPMPVLTLPPETTLHSNKFDLRPCAVQLERCDTDSTSSPPVLEDETKRIINPTGSKKKKKKKQKKSAQRPMAFPPSGPGYKCTVCAKVLLTTTNLTVHMRIHTGEKPYQCSFCKKMFSVQSNLKAHERLHTGEKPYQCSLCNTAFTTRGNFTAHLRSHGVNPYKCSMCTEQFTFSWKLKKHMLVAHNKKMKAEDKQILT